MHPKYILLFLFLQMAGTCLNAQFPRFKALAFYSEEVEAAHVAAYNDHSKDWPWFLEFLGGGVFWRNNWPPMPAKLVINNPMH